jgi:uncharacterized MAPEG superfamily protein
MDSSNAAFATYAIGTTIVALHLLLLAFYTGRVRAKNKAFTNPEDAGLFKTAQLEGEDPDVARVKRAHANAMENALPFFVIATLYVTTRPSKNAALAYFGSFAAARVLHSIVYVWGKQPARTILFTVGVLSLIGMAVHVIRFYS